MNNGFKNLVWPIVIAVLALALSGLSLWQVNQAAGVETLGVTNLDSLHLSDTGGTATPVLLVNQDGAGVIAEFRDGSTPVVQILDGGSLVPAGGFDLNGQGLTWDPTGGTTSQAANDNFITTTIGAATGKFSVLVGNGVIGNGTPSNALNGEDFYVEGGFEADGAARFDGAGDFNSTVDIAGNLTSATGALTIADTLQVTGLADFDAGLTYGSVPLYPVGNAAASQELECGTTGTFTATTLVDPTNVTTPTYVVVSQITAPITTAAYLHVTDPTTTTFTIISLENDFDAGSTGITAHWCVLGTD